MNSVQVNGKPVQPSKIVCIGRNYVAHIEELGNAVPEEMVVFLKPNSAISDRLRAEAGEPLHYEGEIALLIEGDQAVAVGFGLDLTRRELQGRLKSAGLPWERAKAFDGAAVFSPFVPLPAPDTTLGLELTVNGELRQRGDTRLMLYPPATILEQLRPFMSLADGDIIMTGTPAGVGVIRKGEAFRGRITAGDRTLVEATWQAQ